MDENRRISLRLFTQLFSGEILDQPLFGPQMTVTELAMQVERDSAKVQAEEARKIMDLAEANLAEIAKSNEE
jgi:hypothetical protein